VTTFVVSVAIFLALFNNLTNWRPLPGWTYVPLNVCVAVALVALSRVQGLAWEELGFAREGLWPGLRTGGVVVAVIAAGLALALVLPGAERLLADRRVAGLGGAGLVYTALLRIPLGTAVLEEIAFRGVLYGAWLRVASPTQAAVGSSVVFGLWHIVPMLELLRTNSLGGGALKTSALVALGVVGTTAAGLIFVAMRVWTTGLVAPLLVHAATNSLATVAAFIWQRA
jgi:uncharacterized protein